MNKYVDQKKAGLEFANLKSTSLLQNNLVLEDNRSSTVQCKSKQLLQRNNTGLPDDLKSGMENLSGINLDNVRVHYNSPKPSAVQAHAYAQGTDIHLASGQEKHLPHELGHVVQQAQGRVRANNYVGGMPVNDSEELEKDATNMGKLALQRVSLKKTKNNSDSSNNVLSSDKASSHSSKIIQGRWSYNRDLAELTGEVLYYDSDSNLLFNPENRELKAIGDDTGKILSQEEADKLMRIIELDTQQEDYQELISLGFTPEDIEALDGMYNDDVQFEDIPDLDNEVVLAELPSPKKVDLFRELGVFSATDLSSTILPGSQIDTSRLDSASGEKTAYNIKDDDESALIVKRNVMPSSISLADEVETLYILQSKYKLPVSQINNVGVINIGDIYYPALVMKKYEGSSKMIGHNRSSRYVQSESAPEVVSMLDVGAALSSLNSISSILISKKIAIPDLQFLVDDESNFLINDPNGYVTSKDKKQFKQVHAQNMELLGGLIRTIKAYASESVESTSESKVTESDNESSDDEGAVLDYWESEVSRAESVNQPKLTKSILKRIQKEESTPELEELIERLKKL